MKTLNLRDLATYTNNQLKPGLIYRSAVVRDDAEALKLLNIIDLRTIHEINNDPDYVGSANYHHYEALSNDDFKSIETSLLAQGISGDSTYYFLNSLYPKLLRNNQAYRKYFDHLLKQEVPILFHCSAGKDRTGMLAALTLLALDIDKKLVFQDYLASEAELLKDPYFKSLNRQLVSLDWLSNALNTIEKDFGSLDNYFEKEYGLTRAKRDYLKSLYLQKS